MRRYVRLVTSAITARWKTWLNIMRTQMHGGSSVVNLDINQILSV
jgi:hypothetical protein